MKKHTIVIAGAGGMGSATGLLLREIGDFEVDLWIGDADEERARTAAAWIREGSVKPGTVEAFHLPLDGTSPAFDAALKAGEILLDCLPGKEAPRMARLARQHRLHYANLTEHVKETEEVTAIAQGAEQGFLLQTGLAPGFIDVLANGLFQQFCRDYEVEGADRIALRVGALTTTAHAPHFYGFTWSSIGVATEYVEPATVVRGVVYEEALTSGGAADLPDALHGRVKDLDYKTLRYPGHYDWVESLLQRAPQGADPATHLLEQMTASVPFVDDDLVVFYAAVEGPGADQVRRRLQRCGTIRPRQIGARQLKAIQTTTCAGLAESARLLLNEGLKGVCLQSQIDPAHFMAGPFISTIYG
jgi:saccharopine dehydrogenase-like NADP-dependent oxidoreductase